MSNLLKTVYIFEERLSFIDMCKIVALFSNDGYEPSYFSFHSEAIKRDGYDNNFNLTLTIKDKNKNTKNKNKIETFNENQTIEINSTSITFYGKDARELLAQYEKVIDILNRNVNNPPLESSGL